MDEALVFFRFLHFAATLTLFGGAGFRVYAMSEAGIEALAAFDRWFARLAAAGSFIVLLSGIGLLMATTATMANAAAAAFDPELLGQVLSGTRFGEVWAFHLAVSALLVAVCLTGSRRPDAVLAVSLLLAASLAWTGHAAMGTGTAGLAREANQTMHVLAAGLWVGGLIPLAWLLRHAHRPGPQQSGWRVLAREILPRFSRMGYAAVGLILATGCANTALLVGSAHALVASPYGRVLLLKIVLFAAMVGLAIVNRYRLLPRLCDAAEGGPAVAALAGSVLGEQILGFAVIAVVSQLGTMMPAMHP